MNLPGKLVWARSGRELFFESSTGDSLFLVFDPPQDAGDRAQPAVVVHHFDAELESRMGAGRKP